MSKFLTKL